MQSPTNKRTEKFGPLQSEEARAACRQHALELTRRYVAACNYTPTPRRPADKDGIERALRKWLVIEGLSNVRIVRGAGVTSSIPAKGLLLPGHEPEDRSSALRTNNVYRATREILKSLHPHELGRSNLGIATISLLGKYGASSPRGGLVTHMMYSVMDIASYTLGAASLPSMKHYELYLPWLEALEAGCMLVWLSDFELRYIERPYRVLLDEDFRIHSDTEASLVFGDGIALYYLHGLQVPEYVVKTPADKITAQMIEEEWNVEVRRILLDKMGEERFITSSGMKPVDHDDKFGTLYVKHWDPHWWRGRTPRPIARLRVINRSPEPDGSYKIYWLPINPDLYDGDAGEFAHAAAASTWRTTPGGKELFFENWMEYNPIIET